MMKRFIITLVLMLMLAFPIAVPAIAYGPPSPPPALLNPTVVSNFCEALGNLVATPGIDTYDQFLFVDPTSRLNVRQYIMSNQQGHNITVTYVDVNRNSQFDCGGPDQVISIS